MIRFKTSGRKVLKQKIREMGNWSSSTKLDWFTQLVNIPRKNLSVIQTSDSVRRIPRVMQDSLTSRMQSNDLYTHTPKEKKIVYYVMIPQICAWAKDPAAATAHRLDAALVRVLIGCVFVRVVTELKICHIYEGVLRTIKVAAHNLVGASNFIA
jgi:hypothetical protein